MRPSEHRRPGNGPPKYGRKAGIAGAHGRSKIKRSHARTMRKKGLGS